MQVTSYFGNLKTAPSVKRDVEDAMRSAVSHFQSRIRKLNVAVRDVNGPRGGEDLSCRCVVHLKRMSPIVIEERGDNLRHVLNRVAERLGYNLSEKIDRVRKSRRSRNVERRARVVTEPCLVE